MDSALQLRIAQEQHTLITNHEEYLLSSPLIKRLTRYTELSFLGSIFNLIGLSEIPFSINLRYTKALQQTVTAAAATPSGFSYTGKEEEIVPCYNAMLLEAYCRLGLSESIEVKHALHWIKHYQVFDRNSTTTWPHNGICKHGGCMKHIPCYIGIGKTVRALLTYQEFAAAPDPEVQLLISNGLEYMLQHQFFKRLHSDQPISAHITESMFPQSYCLSLTDLVYILGKTNSWQQPQAAQLLSLLASKRTASGGWKNEYRYNYQGYTAFDTGKKDASWITALYTSWLDKEAFSNAQ